MTQAYPLQWPQGWPRSTSRKAAKFGKTEYVSYQTGGGFNQKRDITMDEAMRRVRYELERLGVNARDDMVVSTNLRLNLSGLPRGDQGEPGDPGVRDTISASIHRACAGTAEEMPAEARPT